MKEYIKDNGAKSFKDFTRDNLLFKKGDRFLFASKNPTVAVNTNKHEVDRFILKKKSIIWIDTQGLEYTSNEMLDVSLYTNEEISLLVDHLNSQRIKRVKHSTKVMALKHWGSTEVK